MEYKYLGNSGIKVSNICLGCLNFGKSEKAAFFNSSRQCDEETSHKLMDKFAEHGGNFIDTADVYAFGNSEKVLGNWLKKHKREKFVIATKTFSQTEPDNINWAGLSRRHLIESCEASLERLQTGYIDLYQAHHWDNATPIEETLRAFDDLIRCGKIHYYGFSNICGWQLQKIADTAKSMNLPQCVSLQQEYSLMERNSEFEPFMVCQNEGMGVLPWSPLKSGLLTGKFKKEETPDDQQSRIGLLNKTGAFATILPQWSTYQNSDEYWKLIDAMRTVAKAQGKSVAQVALRWCLQKDIVSSVIIGVSTMAQLEENMGAATGWKLTTEEMAMLDELSLPVATYPYLQLYRAGTCTAAARYNMYNPGSVIV